MRWPPSEWIAEETNRASEHRCVTITVNEGETLMSKSQDAKKNTKKAPTKTPKEKKEAKRLKKAEKKH